MEEIDLFVKILVFVKILSQCTRKGGRKIEILRIVRDKLITLKNNDAIGIPQFFSLSIGETYTVVTRRVQVKSNFVQ